MTSDSRQNTAAALALTVAAAAAFAPRLLARAYGANPDEMTGLGKLGWRLFAARNLVVGVSALRGSAEARRTILLVQAPDQAVFAHAFATRSVPRATAAAAMATSAAIVVLTRSPE